MALDLKRTLRGPIGKSQSKLSSFARRSFPLRSLSGNRTQCEASTTTPIVISAASLLSDDQLDLGSVLNEDSAPFLYNLAIESSTLPAVSLNSHDIQLGKLLRDGHFCEFIKVKVESKTGINGSPTKNQRQRYMVKCLHPELMENHSPDHDTKISNPSPASSLHGDHDNTRALQQAAARLVLEGLYLAYLDHGSIVKLRGFSMDVQLAGLFNGQKESLFLLTDRIGETLDKLNEKWKWLASQRTSKLKKLASRDHAPLLPTIYIRKGSKNSRDPTLKTYPADLVCLKTNYALQILQALQYLHERGIVLRELCPASIGFLPYPNHHTVQLYDLSSCREIPRGNTRIPGDCSKNARTYFGNKQQYTAPELCYMPHDMNGGNSVKPNLGYNTKADIYSWAMITTEMLTERKPYSNQQVFYEWHAVESGNTRPILNRYHFPLSIKAVLEAAWHHNDRKRPNAEALIKQVSAILYMLEGNGLPRGTISKAFDDSSIQDLPQRASGYVNSDSLTSVSQGWSDVWEKPHNNKYLCDAQIRAETDANRKRLQRRQRNENAAFANVTGFKPPPGSAGKMKHIPDFPLPTYGTKAARPTLLGGDLHASSALDDQNFSNAYKTS